MSVTLSTMTFDLSEAPQALGHRWRTQEQGRTPGQAHCPNCYIGELKPGGASRFGGSSLRFTVCTLCWHVWRITKEQRLRFETLDVAYDPIRVAARFAMRRAELEREAQVLTCW